VRRGFQQLCFRKLFTLSLLLETRIESKADEAAYVAQRALSSLHNHHSFQDNERTDTRRLVRCKWRDGYAYAGTYSKKTWPACSPTSQASYNISIRCQMKKTSKISRLKCTARPQLCVLVTSKAIPDPEAAGARSATRLYIAMTLFCCLEPRMTSWRLLHDGHFPQGHQTQPCPRNDIHKCIHCIYNLVLKLVEYITAQYSFYNNFCTLNHRLQT
jgi:hypothetical protein